MFPLKNGMPQYDAIFKTVHCGRGFHGFRQYNKGVYTPADWTDIEQSPAGQPTVFGFTPLSNSLQGWL
jgi:hypothetical protein